MRLERFLWAKASEVAALRRQQREGRLPAPFTGPRGDFLAALRRPSGQAPLSVIAEYKRASPSRGVICRDLTAAEVARQYAQAGAGAISVLSEERFFQGRLDYLAEAHAALQDGGRPVPLPTARSSGVQGGMPKSAGSRGRGEILPCCRRSTSAGPMGEISS